MKGNIMKKYTVHLRYYIGDPLAEIRQEDLDRIGKTHGVEIFFEKIDNRTFDNGIMKEETLKAIEEIIQDVITVASGDSCGQPLCKNSE
jgi:DNA invertase Pin-like site-specific DNA recombinase